LTTYVIFCVINWMQNNIRIKTIHLILFCSSWNITSSELTWNLKLFLKTSFCGYCLTIYQTCSIEYRWTKEMKMLSELLPSYSSIFRLTIRKNLWSKNIIQYQKTGNFFDYQTYNIFIIVNEKTKVFCTIYRFIGYCFQKQVIYFWFITWWIFFSTLHNKVV